MKKVLIFAIMLIVISANCFAANSKHLFVSYMCFLDDDRHFYSWSGYYHPGPVTGKSLEKLGEIIASDKRCPKGAVIQYWKRFEK